MQKKKTTLIMLVDYKDRCLHNSIINVLITLVRKTVVHGGAAIPHPFGISLFEHNVYFTDWTKMAVMRANKFSDSHPQVVYSTSQTPHGVAVIHQLKQPHGKPFVPLKCFTVLCKNMPEVAIVALKGKS